MFAKTFSARRLGAVLATALIVAPLCPGAPAWQYTHTGGSVNALTEHDGEFIALRSDGALLFSGDARAWEKRAAFESQTRMHAVGDAYLFLSLAGEPRDITRTAHRLPIRLDRLLRGRLFGESADAIYPMGTGHDSSEP